MKEKLGQIISLAKTKTALNTYLVFGGNSLAGFLGMILMILISRYLGPRNFGVFSVLFSLLTIFSKFSDFGFNFAMVREISQARVKNETQRIEEIFRTVFWFKFFLSIFLSLIGVFFAEKISLILFKTKEIINPFLFASFSFFVFYDLVRVYYEANKRFLESVSMYFGANLIKLIFIVFLILFFKNFKNFILIYILGPFLIALIFFIRAKIKLAFKFSFVEFRALFNFAFWMGISVVLSAIGENLNVLLISSKLSSFETGIYSAAEKFLLIFTIFAMAIGTVFISRSSEFLDISQLKNFVKKIAVLQLFLFLLFLLIYPLIPFFPLLLGKEYQNSVAVLKIIFPASLFQLMVTPFNSVFYPLGKSIIFALDAFLQVVFLLGLNSYFLPKLKAQGAALSLLITNIFIFFFNYIYFYFIYKKTKNKD